ncbi:helix-turn-helix domain-containing protein [Gluconacetobacter sp.]|uniref:helix-turn-helix domain-containing protein n=1 Tax=Gluconacetobacter sp. TaxID=1935994 RepID=UPI0039E7BD3F
MKLLIAARRDKGLTQATLAERLGKPQSYVAKYETGERRIDVIEFLDITDAIGINGNVILAALDDASKMNH